MAAAQIALIPLSCLLAYVDGRKVGVIDNDVVEHEHDLNDILKECIDQSTFQQMLGPGNGVLRRLKEKSVALKRLVSRLADYEAATTTHLDLISTAFNVRTSSLLLRPSCLRRLLLRPSCAGTLRGLIISARCGLLHLRRCSNLGTVGT